MDAYASHPDSGRVRSPGPDSYGYYRATRVSPSNQIHIRDSQTRLSTLLFNVYLDEQELVLMHFAWRDAIWWHQLL